MYCICAIVNTVFHCSNDYTLPWVQLIAAFKWEVAAVVAGGRSWKEVRQAGTAGRGRPRGRRWQVSQQAGTHADTLLQRNGGGHPQRHGHPHLLTSYHPASRSVLTFPELVLHM